MDPSAIFLIRDSRVEVVYMFYMAIFNIIPDHLRKNKKMVNAVVSFRKKKKTRPRHEA